jgi:hypothetical protein
MKFKKKEDKNKRLEEDKDYFLCFVFLFCVFYKTFKRRSLFFFPFFSFFKDVFKIQDEEF